MSMRSMMTRLEQRAARLVLDQHGCPACGGRPLIAFADEPKFIGLRGSYIAEGGVCVMCRRPPPGVKVLDLARLGLAAVAREHVRGEDAHTRYLQRLTLAARVHALLREQMRRERLQEVSV